MRWNVWNVDGGHWTFEKSFRTQKEAEEALATARLGSRDDYLVVPEPPPACGSAISTDTTRKIAALRCWSKDGPTAFGRTRIMCLSDIADEMERMYQEMIRRFEKIRELEWLVRELEGHEGAEGWSQYLRQRLDAYQFETEVEEKT